MSKSTMNLQDVFLNQVRKEGVPVTIFLVNGVQLRGMVRGFDPFTVLLEAQGRPTQLVYKHSVTSIVPMRPVAAMSGDPAATARAVPVRSADEMDEETE